MATFKLGARAKITKAAFDRGRFRLEAKLSARLSEEIQTDEFSPQLVDAGAPTDLWDLPAVPSKAVVRLSGIVEEALGVKLPTKFVRSGGYESLEEAIEHLITQLRNLCAD